MRMNLASRMDERSRWLSPRLPAALCLALVAGCGREEIRVYTAPKDKPAPSQPMTVRPRPIARPQLEWKLPAGWRELGAGQMSVATFSITGPDGKAAQVAVTPLPLMAGRESMVVNMMRSQVGLEELSEEETQKQFEPVEIGGEPGRLFELTGKSEDALPMRIITAMAHRGDTSWFYKLSGDAVMVEAQKPVFVEFLKSVRIKASEPAGAAPGETTKFNWQVPAQWKPLPAGAMQVARFAAPERGGAKAEVFVSIFPNDTGGQLANVNRWRAQLGLGAISDGELASVVSPLDPSNPDSLLVDLTNNDRRLVGAIVPRDGRFWFYKLLGDGAAVSPEKEAFVAFAKSQP
jgi:hypothetical protein